MRLLLSVAVLGFAFVAMPAMGQQGNAGGSALGHAFGSANCPQRISCPGNGDSTSSDDLITVANACITRYFGYTSSSGFFDNTQGLDTNNCLASLPNVIPKGVGQQLSPLCCIAGLPDNTCVIHCDLVTVR